jgi:hypothetical protein
VLERITDVERPREGTVIAAIECFDRFVGRSVETSKQGVRVSSA